jgi:hypothetical protein
MTMPLFKEKRKKTDRRQRDDGPPPGFRERRGKRDRRQTAISEISFHEWTRYFLRFKKRSMAKAAIQQASAENGTLKSENDPDDIPSGHS